MAAKAATLFLFLLLEHHLRLEAKGPGRVEVGVVAQRIGVRCRPAEDVLFVEQSAPPIFKLDSKLEVAREQIRPAIPSVPALV